MAKGDMKNIYLANNEKTGKSCIEHIGNEKPTRKRKTHTNTKINQNEFQLNLT